MSIYLKKIRENTEFLAVFNEAMSLLFQSGVFEFLKEKGQLTLPFTNNDSNVAAFAAYRSKGYNEAIDDLLYFREKYLNNIIPEKNLVPKYGAVDLALERDDISKEEADAIRSNTKPDYSKYITTKPTNTSN